MRRPSSCHGHALGCGGHAVHPAVHPAVFHTALHQHACGRRARVRRAARPRQFAPQRGVRAWIARARRRNPRAPASAGAKGVWRRARTRRPAPELLGRRHQSGCVAAGHASRQDSHRRCCPPRPRTRPQPRPRVLRHQVVALGHVFCGCQQPQGHTENKTNGKGLIGQMDMQRLAEATVVGCAKAKVGVANKRCARRGARQD